MSDMVPNTKSEQIVMVWASRSTSVLSILGSSMIVIMILRGGREKLTMIHNRLLLGMSTVDMILSCAVAFSSAAIPRTLKDFMYGAIGSYGTCSAQSFIILFGYSVPLYNSMLCIYFLAVITFDVKDDILVKYEPYMHGISIIFPSIVAIFSASSGILQPVPGLIFCWVGNGCEFSDSDCVPQPSKYVFTIYIVQICLNIITMLCIVGSMIVIYWTVRGQARKMRRYYSFSRRNSATRGGSKNSSTDEHEAFIQSSLYSIAFLLTYSWGFALTIMNIVGVGYPPFALLFLEAFFYPLQG